MHEKSKPKDNQKDDASTTHFLDHHDFGVRIFLYELNRAHGSITIMVCIIPLPTLERRKNETVACNRRALSYFDMKVPITFVSGLAIVQTRNNNKNPSMLGKETNKEQDIARILASGGALSSGKSDVLPPSQDYDNGNVDSLKLFMSMLEWMEIEGTILKAYNEFGGADTRRPSSERRAVFSKRELDTVDRALEEVDCIVHSIMGGFFKEFHFASGVLNSLLVTFVFAKYPQHFWLLFLVEGLWLLPRNLYERIRAKPLNRVFSYLDFCWISNTFALVALGTIVACACLRVPFPLPARKRLFDWTIGIACGPLLGAAIAFPFNALLFHNLDTMTGLFIHIFPPMVAYTMLWHADEIHAAWPHVFQLDYLSDVQFFERGDAFLSSISGVGLVWYISWLVPYSIWMFLAGIHLPRTDRVDKKGKSIQPRFDTVFHIAMRGGACLSIGKKLWGRSVSVSLRQMADNHFEKRDLLVYLACHALLSIVSILGLSYLCYNSKVAHSMMLVLVVLLSVFRGAKRYSYYTTDMYSRMLRKHFEVLGQQCRHRRPPERTSDHPPGKSATPCQSCR